VSFAARAFLHFVNHNLTMDLHRKWVRDENLLVGMFL
jgi:hypothetical protein